MLICLKCKECMIHALHIRKMLLTRCIFRCIVLTVTKYKKRTIRIEGNYIGYQYPFFPVLVSNFVSMEGNLNTLFGNFLFFCDLNTIFSFDELRPL